MKVLLVNGSPKKDGCSARALEEIRKTLVSDGVTTELFWIGNKPIAGCIACGYCDNRDECVFKDPVNDFLPKAKEADGFIIAAPTYYAGIPGGLKSFLDRVFYAGGALLRGKPAAAVVSSRRAGSTTVFADLNMYFAINEMPIVTSCYWNEVHGYTKEDVEKDLEGLYSLRVLGHNMAYLLKALDLAKRSGLEKRAEKDPRPSTDFIR